MAAKSRKPKLTPPEEPSGTRWILFMPTIPAKPASVRVKIWRRLQAIGAVNLRGAVYALPNRDECVELFEWLAKELRSLGGQASLCEGRFVEARSAEYARVLVAAKALATKLKARRIPADRLSAITEQHGKLSQRFAEIVAIDFLDAPGRVAAEELLAAIQRSISRDGTSGSASSLEQVARPRGATWVTRTGVHVDRIASAWLIRRFIDPQARFKFVPAKGYVTSAGELRFDMFEAEFTHVGDRCTFEVLIERMGLADPALNAIGEIIHDLDLRDHKYGREEAAGVRSAVDGICTIAHDDDQRIAAASAMLDGLHSYFTSQARRRGRQPASPK
jgi:hypothetical protein